MNNSSNNSYRTSHTNLGKGRHYDKNFESKHRAFLWAQEKIILKDIVGNILKRKDFNFLDFACGTGRILSFMSTMTDKATGVDLSEDMLSEAQDKPGEFQLVNADITREEPFRGSKFDLITAFRFFPNAEDGLRSEAATAISKLLSPNGLFVFNNHKNPYSVTGIMMQIYCKFRGTNFRTMSLKEAELMVEQSGMRIERVYHTGVVPGYEWLMFFPFSWYTRLESIFSNFSFFKHVALVQVIVCRLKK